MKPVLHLTKSESDEPVWRKVEAHYEVVLAELRRELEVPTKSDAERTRLCWQIHTIKGFLAHSDQARKKVAGAGE